MSESLVVYKQTHESLQRGLVTGIAKIESLDLALPGVEGQLQRIAVTAQQALALAKDRRDREAEPHAAKLVEVKMRWRPLVDGFEALFKRAKAMAAEVLRKQREEQEKLRLERERALEKAREKERAAQDAEPKRQALNDLRAARAALDELPPAGAPIGVKTERGTLFGRDVWKWEVTDLDQVPNTYTQRFVDPKKVDLAIRNGVREIAGIRIWQDIEMASRGAKR